MGNVLLLFALCAALLHAGFSEILWKGCVGVADNPRGADGFYYDLCIKNHTFSRRRAPFQFISTVLTNVEFNACTFVNTNLYSINFTKSVFQDVVFKDSVFGSFATPPKPVFLERFAFRDVTFEGCRFDKSAALTFSQFEMSNVTFKDCVFESNSLFSLGTMVDVKFINTEFKSVPVVGPSSDKNITFDQLTTRRVSFVKSNFSTPLVFGAVNAADTHINDTHFSEPFSCNGRLTESGLLKPSAFNDTIITGSMFDSNVRCEQTRFRTIAMSYLSFSANVNFSNSLLQDVYWNGTRVRNEGNCTTLDLSGSSITRGSLSNAVVECELDLRDAVIDKVLLKDVRARRFQLNGTQFNQERIDGRCCTEVCPSAGCRCNYTQSPTDTCPKTVSKAQKPQPKSEEKQPFWIRLLKAFGFA